MIPNIKQLEALHWAARLGSFQAAANRLNTTQSAISKRIAELEAQLGRPLFDRSRRNAQLTPAGERAAAGAAKMLDVAQGLVDDTIEPTFDKTFRLAATELIGMTWLSALIAAIHAEFPGLRLEVELHNGGVLLQGLNQGHHDLALLPGPMWGRMFEAVPLKALSRSWMASPSMGLPKRVLSVKEISGLPIAAQYRDTIHAQLQAAWFRKEGFPLKQLVQVHSFAVLGELVKAGTVIAQLPVAFYADDVRNGRLVRLRVAPELPDVEYFAVYGKSGPHPLSARIAKLAKRHCDFSKRS